MIPFRPLARNEGDLQTCEAGEPSPSGQPGFGHIRLGQLRSGSGARGCRPLCFAGARHDHLPERHRGWQWREHHNHVVVTKVSGTHRGRRKAPLLLQGPSSGRRLHLCAWVREPATHCIYQDAPWQQMILMASHGWPDEVVYPNASSFSQKNRDF